ncbi:MAG TPA: tetratricopeptide repeat protein, partial [Thermoanaerobaculia bacterium]|nr:tetratricopeptide repeat protein [Thermoanaerobaculia bacterium]
AAIVGILAVERGSKKLVPSAAVVLGAALVVGPAVVESSRAAGSFVFVRSYGAINLWMGNDPAGGGVQNARPNAAWDRLVGEPYRNGAAPGEEERYFLSKTLARAASDPAGFARVFFSKAVWMTQAEEPRDNHSFAFFRARSLPLRFLPGFGVLAALASVGLVAALRTRPRPTLPLLFLAAAALPALVALAGLRYRLPTVPILALFAGAGAIRLLDRGRARDLRALGPPALLAAAVFALSHVRTHAPSHVFAEELSLEANSLVELGRLAEAEATLRQAMAADPGSGLPVEVLGRLREKEGKTREARDLFARSLELAPDSRSARFFLARTEEELGNEAAALEEYRKALEISPRFFPARFHLGLLLLRTGNAPAAASEFAAAASISPSEADPLLKLAEARRAERRWAEATEAARKGARLAPERLDAWLLLGSIAAEARDLTLLAEAVQKASAIGGREHPAIVLLVAKRQRLEGDREGALVTLTGLVRRHPESALAAETFLAVSREAGREGEARALLDALRSR